MNKPKHDLTFTNLSDSIVCVDCACNWHATSINDQLANWNAIGHMLDVLSTPDSGDLIMPKNPPFAGFSVELRVKAGIKCDTDAQIEAMAERIEDADIETVIRLAVNTALERAGLDGELSATIIA